MNTAYSISIGLGGGWGVDHSAEFHNPDPNSS